MAAVPPHSCCTDPERLRELTPQALSPQGCPPPRCRSPARRQLRPAISEARGTEGVSGELRFHVERGSDVRRQAGRLRSAPRLGLYAVGIPVGPDSTVVPTGVLPQVTRWRLEDTRAPALGPGCGRPKTRCRWLTWPEGGSPGSLALPGANRAAATAASLAPLHGRDGAPRRLWPRLRSTWNTARHEGDSDGSAEQSPGVPRGPSRASASSASAPGLAPARGSACARTMRL